MTTPALTRARRHRAHAVRNPRIHPRNPFMAKPYVECPVCEVPTGRVHQQGYYGYIVTLLVTASGPEDGARCKDHARTEDQRAAETAAALAWIERHRAEWLVVE